MGRNSRITVALSPESSDLVRRIQEHLQQQVKDVDRMDAPTCFQPKDVSKTRVVEAGLRIWAEKLNIPITVG